MEEYSSARSQTCADAQERSPLIDVVRENRAAARGIAGELSFLAEAFQTVGNTLVADRLARLAADVGRHGERVSRAFGRDLTDRLHESEQATANMIGAAIAGISIGTRAKVAAPTSKEP